MSIDQVINIVFEVMIWLVIIRCILSFIPHNPGIGIFRFVYEVTEPVMGPFRRLVPSAGGLDFSPIVVLLVLELVRRLVMAVVIGLINII